MHARQLIELAALAACHAPAILNGPGRMDAAGVEHYWVASKCRLDLWGRAIKQMALAPTPEVSPAQAARYAAVMEEVLASEVLTRVWSALLDAYDQRHGQHELAPIARSVYLGQLEMRNRVLQLLVSGPHVSGHQAVALDRLRRRVERWSDLLVGHVLVLSDVRRYAADPDRALSYVDDLRQRPDQTLDPLAWQVSLAAIRASFLSGCSTAVAHAEANARVAASVLACLEPAMFDATGLFPALWVLRLEAQSADVAGWVSQLFREPRGLWPNAFMDDDRVASRSRRRFG